MSPGPQKSRGHGAFMPSSTSQCCRRRKKQSTLRSYRLRKKLGLRAMGARYVTKWVTYHSHATPAWRQRSRTWPSLQLYVRTLALLQLSSRAKSQSHLDQACYSLTAPSSNLPKSSAVFSERTKSAGDHCGKRRIRIDENRTWSDGRP
jgi:hypothetical protein